MLARAARCGSQLTTARRRLLSSSSRAGAAGTSASLASPAQQGRGKATLDDALRGTDDLDRAELVSRASRAVDRAVLQRVVAADEEEASAQEWLAEVFSGHLDPAYEEYISWEAAQVRAWRASRGSGELEQLFGKGATADAYEDGDDADAGPGAEGMEGESKADTVAGAGVEGAGEATMARDAEGAPTAGGEEDASFGAGAGLESTVAEAERLLPRLPVWSYGDFPGELMRDEVLTPAQRAQVEEQEALYAAEDMPWELAELSHRQKERLWDLHVADPVTYSADRIAAMLALPGDHIRAALFLQQLQAGREAEVARAEEEAVAEQVGAGAGEGPSVGEEDADPGAGTRDARAKARRARLAQEQLAELAEAYDRQFDPFLSLNEVRAHLRRGARLMRKPALATEAVVRRVFERQRISPSAQATLGRPDYSGPLERFVEFEMRAHHFGRTAPSRLEDMAASVLRGPSFAGAGLGAAGDAGPLSETEGLAGEGISDADPAYRRSVLSHLRKLDLYAAAEEAVFEQLGQWEAPGQGGADGAQHSDQAGHSANSADAADPSSPSAHPGAGEAEGESLLDATHPGLTMVEVARMAAQDAARLRTPELASPEVVDLLFEAQYFASEFDLAPVGAASQNRNASARRAKDAPEAPGPAYCAPISIAARVAAGMSAAGAPPALGSGAEPLIVTRAMEAAEAPGGALEDLAPARGRGDGDGVRGATSANVRVAPEEAPFTTVVQTGLNRPTFRYVPDRGPDARYLSAKEVESLQRLVRRAEADNRAAFDPEATSRTIAQNRRRRSGKFGAVRGHFVVIDSSTVAGGRRGLPSDGTVRKAPPVVHVREGDALREGTREERVEALRYLGHGERRPHRLRRRS